MQALSDAQLLRQYSNERSERAFTELVARHTNLVYSAALRQVGSPELAAEVAQRVFIGLAQSAPALSSKLAADASLAGWLCRSARNLSLNLRRDEFRRHARERLVMEPHDSSSETELDWKALHPVLDEAMSELDETDYDAIVLRFFQNQDLRSVGRALGLTDDAAQKRVSRALEKLREKLVGRGITASAGTISAAVAVNAVTAAPAGLVATLSSAGLAGPTLCTTAAKTIAMTTLQKTVLGAVLATAIGTGIYEGRQTSQLRDQVQTLRQQQQASLADYTGRLNLERDEYTRQLAALRNDNERLRGDTTELLKLRSELAELRKDSKRLTQLKSTAGENLEDANSAAVESAARVWLEKVTLLQRSLEQMPERNIPEMQFLNERDWLRLAEMDLHSEADVRRALAELRKDAKAYFARSMGRALNAYLDANDGQLPKDVTALRPYFNPSVDESLLQRYTMLKTGRLTDLDPKFKHMLIGEKAPVDGEYDYILQIGLDEHRAEGVGVLEGSTSMGGWAASTKWGRSYQ